MNNHTTDSCGILKELKSGSGGFNRKKSVEVICFHRGKPGHMRTECQSCQRGLEAKNRVNNPSTKDSMAEGNMALTQHGMSTGDRNLF